MTGLAEVLANKTKMTHQAIASPIEANKLLGDPTFAPSDSTAGVSRALGSAEWFSRDSDSGFDADLDSD